MRPKLTAAVLAGGTGLLVAGTAVAIALPSRGAFWQPDSQMMAAMMRPAAATATPTPSATQPAPSPSATAPSPSATPSPTATATPKPSSDSTPVVKAPKSTSPASTAPKPTAKVTTPAPAKTSAAAPKPEPARAPLTYTVQRGDTLSGIAQWFNLHGYGDLYARNADVIGANPDLIIPGERITIGGTGMTLQPPA